MVDFNVICNGITVECQVNSSLITPASGATAAICQLWLGKFFLEHINSDRQSIFFLKQIRYS